MDLGDFLLLSRKKATRVRAIPDTGVIIWGYETKCCSNTALKFRIIPPEMLSYIPAAGISK